MKNVPRHLGSARGFSVVDMVASVAIIATVGAMAVPQVINVVDSMRLGMSLRDVERELQYARLKAVSTNRPMRVRFNCPEAGKLRVVEVIGTAAAPASGDLDLLAERCSETSYPYRPTGADTSRLTRPNNDGPVRTLYEGTTITASQTLEFWADGTVHTACQAACDTSGTKINVATITLTRKSKTKNITVNGLGKILQDR
jgi:hypothetical protein